MTGDADGVTVLDPGSQQQHECSQMGARGWDTLPHPSHASGQARAHRPHVEACLVAVAQPAVLRGGRHNRDNLELVLAAARLLEDLELQHAVVSK